VNETALHQRISNIRGTVAIAHSDADNGNGEFFINLQSNPEFDTECGGFCVFAEVVEEASFRIVDSIASALLHGPSVPIKRMTVDTGVIYRWVGGGLEPRMP
jgi:cyclophilin family peptidyl-prolyl cis-trans isomerase